VGFAECGATSSLLPSRARRRREYVRPASLHENPRVMDATFVLFTGFTAFPNERARRRDKRAAQTLSGAARMLRSSVLRRSVIG
jgi:hypothetical protein